jgi:hypothetical protein
LTEFWCSENRLLVCRNLQFAYNLVEFAYNLVELNGRRPI